MKIIKNLLALICILPFLLTIYVATLNIKKSSSLTILTWQSKERSLAFWITLGTIAGFSISSLNSITSNYTPIELSRRVKKSFDDSNLTSDEDINDSFQVDDTDNQQSLFENDEDDRFAHKSNYFERDFRDPSPTISVPYKILSKISESKSHINSPRNSSSQSQKIRLDKDTDNNKEENLFSKSDWTDDNYYDW